MASTKKTAPTKTTSKYKFRSKFEGSIAANLEARGVHYDYESTRLSYTVTRDYKPDFMVGDIYVEAKGYFRSADQRKMRSVKDQHPDLDIRFVFQKATTRVQGSKMTCIEWCEKYGFDWAEGTIPKDWLHGTTETN